MHKPIKYVEKGLTYAAKGAWVVFDTLNSIKPNPSFTPKWSDKPLLKSWQKSKPTLGWPRTTDSLCPQCVIEAREGKVSETTQLLARGNERDSFQVRRGMDGCIRICGDGYADRGFQPALCS